MRGLAASSTIADAGAAPGDHDVRRAQPDHRRDLPGRNADSDDGVRPQGPQRPAAPTNSGTANNYVVLQQFDNVTDKFGGKVDVTINPRLTAFGRFGYRDADIFDQPPIPLPSGGAGNAETYVTNKQLAAGMTYMPSATSLFEVRFGWSRTTAGKNPAALGSTSALDAYGITGLPTDPRVAGGLPNADHDRATANSAARPPTRSGSTRPSTTQRSTTPGSSGRQSLKSGYEFQHIQTEVQDVNPLYGRDTYNGQFTRPAGVAANTIYNLVRLHARPAQQLRAEQHPRRQPAAEHALPLPAGRRPRRTTG